MTDRRDAIPLEQDAAVVHFGVCPDCGYTDGYTNAGSTHVFFCRTCRTRWTVGCNLFSDWKQETEEEQRARWNEIGLEGFREVDSIVGVERVRRLRLRRTFRVIPGGDGTTAAQSGR